MNDRYNELIFALFCKKVSFNFKEERMRKQIVWLTVAAMLLSTLPGYTGDSNKDKAKKRAEEAKKKSEREKDKEELQKKADDLDDRTRVDVDNDEGINTGAIAGSIAVAALVGTVVAKKKGAAEKAAQAKAADQAAAAAPAADAGNADGSVNFASMDTDNDGKLAKQEFLEGMNGFYKRLFDSDGNGAITREEAVAAYGDRGAKYFDTLDKEKAGSLAIPVMVADATRVFDWADADHDGFLTAEEKDAAKKTASTEQKQ